MQAHGSPIDLVGERLQQLRATKALAEQELRLARPSEQLTEESVRELIASVGPIGTVLAEADPEAKALLYNELGLELTFDAKRRLVEVQASPVYLRWCRRGD